VAIAALLECSARACYACLIGAILSLVLLTDAASRPHVAFSGAFPARGIL